MQRPIDPYTYGPVKGHVARLTGVAVGCLCEAIRRVHQPYHWAYISDALVRAERMADAALERAPNAHRIGGPY